MKQNNSFEPNLAQFVFDAVKSIVEPENLNQFKSTAHKLNEGSNDKLEYKQVIAMFLTQMIAERFILTPRISTNADSKPIDYYIRSLKHNFGDLKVFFSYRRSDSLNITERICDHLDVEMGRNFLFRDSVSIPGGENFEEVIGDAIAKCTVFVVVIGPYWISGLADKGVNLLRDPSDMVRIELLRALNNKKPIIPVLVNNAVLPAKKDLPKELQGLLLYNAIPLRNDPYFGTDIADLIRDIRMHDRSLGHISIPLLPYEAKTPVRMLIEASLIISKALHEVAPGEIDKKIIKQCDFLIQLWARQMGVVLSE